MKVKRPERKITLTVTYPLHSEGLRLPSNFPATLMEMKPSGGVGYVFGMG